MMMALFTRRERLPWLIAAAAVLLTLGVGVLMS